MQVVSLLFLLAYPLVVIPLIQSNVMSANYFMTATVTLVLKITSFHHVMNDNRKLMERIEAAKKADDYEGDQAHRFDIHPETFKLASSYPNNLRLIHYVRYLCAPTFCY